MRNKYLLLGAASAMMLAACSEDIKGPDSNIRPAENALNLTSLDAASQAGRVKLPGETRGPKASRLQLVAKIAPVAESDAANHHWSATGIAFAGGNAYVSWHSNHQATVAADAWGGAIDVINVAALKAGERNNVITNTYTSRAVKFNGVVNGGAALYLPVTSYSNGATVARWTPGATAMDTIAVPGSSANAISVASDLYVVTGYAGGVYSVPADFDAETEPVEVVAYDAEFGGKYIDGGFVLRTDDDECEIKALLGDLSIKGAPLVSSEKYAETYNPTDGWTLVEGTTATHYGKHTMAVDGDYIYVGGGKGENGENGFRVYGVDGIKWQSGMGTNAVCVSDEYVYAATGMGLRVYEKFDGTNLNLYAFEVLNYDENGNAAAGPDSNSPVAGTDAHSPNFVAVDGDYIYVACGQSGVYVFKLVKSNETGFKTTTGIDETQDAKVGETVKVKAPEVPGVESWKDEEGNVYEPGKEYDFESGKIVVVEPVYKEYPVTYDLNGGEGNVPTDQTVKHGEKPALPEADPTKAEMDFVAWSADGTNPLPEDFKAEGPVTLIALWKEHVYKYILKFIGDPDKNDEIEGLPGVMKSDENSFEIPTSIPVWGKRNFYGWHVEADADFEDPAVIKVGTTFVIPGDATEFTLYGVWSSNMTGGTGEEEEKPVTPPNTDPVIGGEETNGGE